MSEGFFFGIVRLWIYIALAMLPIMLLIQAPYGRHLHGKWGPLLENRIGWVIMELPALLVYLAFLMPVFQRLSLPVLIFSFLWVLHYFYRSIVFPFRTHTKGKKIPLFIVFLAIVFNTMNGFINGHYFAWIHPQYDLSWFGDLRFILGLFLFLGGLIINRIADDQLIALRKNSNSGYSIPREPLFKFVSCPNHLGEIIEWIGFAVMTWSLPAAAFALWTIANLVPRSLSHHRWYKREFPEYPSKRKALIPFIL